MKWLIDRVTSWVRGPVLAGTLALLRLLPRVSRGMTVLLAVTVLLSSLLPIGFTVVTGLLVGSIPATISYGFSSSAGRHTLALLLIAALLIAGLRVLAPLEGALSRVFGRAVDRHLQERVMAAVGRPAGIAHLEDPEVLDLIRTSQGVGAQGVRPGTAIASLAYLLPSWIASLGSAVILAAFHLWLALIWLVMWPVVLYYLQREYLKVAEVAGGEAGTLRRADYYRDLAITPGAGKEVRVLGLPRWLSERYGEAWARAMEPVWKSRKPARAVPFLSTAVVVAVTALTYGLLAWAGAHGDISLGALAVFTRATFDAGMFRAFDSANEQLAYAAVSVPSMLRLEERLQRSEPPVRTALPVNSNDIRLEAVRFRYPGQVEDALAGVDLHLPPGRSLAIVGANGAGKTTIVKLLCKLYEPSGGSITVAGVDLAMIDAAEWRRQVAAIFQDFTHFHLSARDNIALGALQCEDDSEGIREAARRAGALEVIEALPHGWDTVLSRQYTGGTDLSGGQWQRVALARALFAVHGGARVLILDEPTANLDVRAEADLYERFLELTAGLTTVLISHRFSTVRRADQIVVLEGGCITERGNHDDLMELNGIYAHMFALQAERFAEEVA